MSDQRIQYDEEMVGASHPTKSDTLNRLALVEHDTDGNHTVISLDEQSAAPAGEADHGKVYAKEVDGVTELFYLDSAGNEIQITSGGSIMGALESRIYSVTFDSDGTASLESKNVTIDEVEDTSQWAVLPCWAMGRELFDGTALNDSLTDTARPIIFDLTSSTNMEVTYRDSGNVASGTYKFAVQAKFK